jgi:hypothetical protein
MQEDFEYEFSLTYVSQDSAWATRLAGELANGGVRVARSYERSRHCVVLWSAKAKDSETVHSDLQSFADSRLALGDRDRQLIFVQLGGGIPPNPFVDAPVLNDLADTGSLDESPAAISEVIWNRLRENILIAAQSGPSSGPGRKHNRRPGSTQQQAAEPAPVSDELVPVKDVGQRYRLFPSTHDIISHAPELSGKAINNITSGLLMAAISNRGAVTRSPTWAAAWLRSRLGDEGNKRLIEIARLNAERGQKGTRAAPVPVLTPGSDAILVSARDIARRTSSSGEIHLRHLLGAILVDARGPEQSSALAAIGELGHSVVKLREAFFDFVREADDDDDAWGEILLGAKEDSRILPGFDADSDRGDDQLDIKPDVMAFAALIAARTLKPPLSIGLFGEWGSGKTFFMRMLARQVTFRAREARDELERNRTPQRNQPYYRRIVQIEFNAWHYADGNLWASLVQHIFDNLRIIDEKKGTIEELQEPILQKLKVEKAAETQARREHQAAKWKREAAMRAVSAAKQHFQKKAEELAEISGKNVLTDLPTEDLAQAFAPLFKELGITTAINRGVELRATLVEAKTMLTRSHAALAPLLVDKAGRRSVYLGMALIAGPAAALAVNAIPRWLGAEGVSTFTAMATGAASLLASLTAWLRHQLKWVGDRLIQIEEVQQRFDQSIEKAQSENLKAIREAEERLKLLEADYLAAQRREEEATRRTIEAETKLKEATVPRLLSTFIEERANSNDYRKHLGMLALVRNDFERLSDLISDENAALNGPTDNRPDRFPTIEDELKDEKQRINRIVLYIDDLDRCPPAKVVEVLQAVHLLLAFPLFVVVVGVDARWVLRSVEARYRELLKSDDRPRDHDPNTPEQKRVDEFKELFGYASAHDYVEKIFQVPFWLKPMSPESSRRLVRDLLKPSMTDPAPETRSGPVRPAGKGSMIAPTAADGTNTDSAGQPTPAASEGASPSDSDKAATNADKTADEERRTLPDLSPASLDIAREEFDAISDLAPLLGRSPRTLKRFVNVYRLIRVGLSPWERDYFLSSENGLADYRAVLLLLAIDTGAPKVAGTFFSTIREVMSSIPLEPAHTKQGKDETRPDSLTSLLARLDQDKTINELEEWHRVGGWLHSRLRSNSLPEDLGRIARWIPRVSRFSFHTGRLG